ncbi:hypothetical protein [Bartonella sp. B1098]|nr:hypothetical protein [Bartonella sp. B1098]
MVGRAWGCGWVLLELLRGMGGAALFFKGVHVAYKGFVRLVFC